MRCKSRRTYDPSHGGTGSQGFDMVAQQGDDHAHPKQVLSTHTRKLGTKRQDRDWGQRNSSSAFNPIVDLWPHHTCKLKQVSSVKHKKNLGYPVFLLCWDQSWSLPNSWLKSHCNSYSVPPLLITLIALLSGALLSPAVSLRCLCQISELPGHLN